MLQQLMDDSFFERLHIQPLLLAIGFVAASPAFLFGKTLSCLWGFSAQNPVYRQIISLMNLESKRVHRMHRTSAPMVLLRHAARLRFLSPNR
jgi:hypothetical protein